MIDINTLNTQELKDLKDKVENEIKKYEVWQLAKKVQLNSAYGTLGSKYFSFFDIRLAESITVTGQFAIQFIAKRVNEFLNIEFKTINQDYVIASDTDSIYVTLGKYIEDENLTNIEQCEIIENFASNKLQGVIDSAITEIFEYTKGMKNILKMKREAIASRGVWTGKKRYALDVYDDEGIKRNNGKIKITGLQIISSSTPTWCKDKLHKALEIILRGTEKELNEYVKSVKNDFFNLSIYDISISMSVSSLQKKFGDKSIPINTFASMIFNKAIHDLGLIKDYELIKEKDKIKFCYIKEPNVFRSHVMGFKDIVPEQFVFDIDYPLQFEKTFLNSLTTIIEPIGWAINKPRALKFK